MEEHSEHIGMSLKSKSKPGKIGELFVRADGVSKTPLLPPQVFRMKIKDILSVSTAVLTQLHLKFINNSVPTS
jgi:hypothetical protein